MYVVMDEYTGEVYFTGVYEDCMAKMMTLNVDHLSVELNV